MAGELLSISDAARVLSDQYGQTVLPRYISDLFYSRVLSDAVCPVLSNRRIIPRGYMPTVAEALIERGRIVISQDPVPAGTSS